MPSPADRPILDLAELARRTGAALDGDGRVAIRAVATLDAAMPGTIAFLANRKYRPQLATTQASAVILSPADAAATGLPKLVSANPYATYAKVAAILHPPARATPGVHPAAIVDASARIAADAAIGARAVVGARVELHAGCVVGDDVTIGDDTVVHPNACIEPGCVIGARTTIHAGAVVGSDGFGMAEEGGRWLRIPQVGRVVVGDDCEIGANTTIDRGAIGDTVIEDDVKLDNQIQVAHNCFIGRHTAIAGCAGIAGSVRIGRNCRIGGAAMISGHLSIADGTVVSGGTLIADTIDTPGVYTGVFPAMPYREWQRIASETRRLRDLAHRVRALERSHPHDEGHEGNGAA